jgi:hypothetical protein
MFRDSVHEIGHLFGLQHNPSVSSVMFFDDFGQSSSLDFADLRALAAMHKLRTSIVEHAASAAQSVSHSAGGVPPVPCSSSGLVGTPCGHGSGLRSATHFTTVR